MKKIKIIFFLFFYGNVDLQPINYVAKMLMVKIPDMVLLPSDMAPGILISAALCRHFPPTRTVHTLGVMFPHRSTCHCVRSHM